MRRGVVPAALVALLLGVSVAYGGGVGTVDAICRQILEDLGLTVNGEAAAGSGDITSVVAGNGLTGGATSGAATVDVAVSAGLTANADEITLDDDLQDLAAISGVRGDVIYYGASGWARLGAGSAGQVLESGGAGADPSWGTDGGGSAGPFHVFLASQGIAPASNFATFTTRGASTNGAHGVLAFDQTTAEAIVFEGVLSSGYSDASDLTVSIYWTTSATSGSAVWSAEVEAIDGLDIDADSFDTAENSAASAANATSGIYSVATISLANAEADAIAAGEPFRLRIARVPTDGGDDLAADAQLLRVVVSQ